MFFAMTVLSAELVKRAEWLEVDRDGIRQPRLFRVARIAWSEIAAVELAAGITRELIVTSHARRRLTVPALLLGETLLATLRAHAPPGVYRVRAEDELVISERVARLRREGARVMMQREPRAAYREAERRAASFSLRRRLAPERRAFRRALVVSITFGLATMLVAWLVTIERVPVALAVLVVSLVLTAGAQRHFLGIALGLRVLRRRLIERLGPDVELDARGMLVSRDRRTRVRQLPSDLDDPAIGLHLHVEVLDADGRVERSAIVLGLDLGLPASARPMALRERADVQGHAVSSLDDDAWPVEPRLLRTDGQRVETLVIEQGPDGAILSRLGRGGRPLGDTFHEDADAARRQAAHETEHGAWRDAAEAR
ncbi:hypothetical protein DB32_007704 [Sandaracinus amylolyticus]|uniref:Uncharacterized protein n=2 Tax=Sandaracinus amylolyticus TaxID=927083 RepID=A0A0F6W947_9BACT|nr:hypothetical protein DB32_007704 [Sandaracinus amylolyticus]